MTFLSAPGDQQLLQLLNRKEKPVSEPPDGMDIEAGSPFPIPIRQQKTPCGECHLKPGEKCDVCGAVAN